MILNILLVKEIVLWYIYIYNIYIYIEEQVRIVDGNENTTSI